MKGDFSRDTFNRHKHFSRVLQQQGRVQLDADTNEQTAILLHYLRTLAADLIGPYARPEGSDGGFKITITSNDSDLDLCISEGRYYVDGILCENDKDTKYTEQEDYPLAESLDNSKSYLVYLDVWERHITALEDPNIREKALGGPDTTTRTKIVWQVKVDAGDDSCRISESCEPIDKWVNWVNRWQPNNRGLLRARLKPPVDSTDPCLTAPDARYRGQENQLYRIEIHQGGKANNGGNCTACATFKWSRDNGAIVSRVVEFSDTKLVVEKPHGFEAGIWVELINNDQELRGEPGNLVKLIKVEGNCFTIELPVSEPCAEAKHQPNKVRRWDQCWNGSLKLENGAVPITETVWIEIENGIEIRFVPPACGGDAHCYRTGDYWLIPARVATGKIEWSASDDEGVQPFGIEHHYAPLAIINEGISTDFKCEFKPPHECKCEDPPADD